MSLQTSLVKLGFCQQIQSFQGCSKTGLPRFVGSLYLPLQPPSHGQPRPHLLGQTHQQWTPTSSCLSKFHALCCPGFLFLCLPCNAEPVWFLLFSHNLHSLPVPTGNSMGWELHVSPAAPHQLPSLIQQRATRSNIDTARSIPMIPHWAQPSLPLQAEPSSPSNCASGVQLPPCF